MKMRHFHARWRIRIHDLLSEKANSSIFSPDALFRAVRFLFCVVCGSLFHFCKPRSRRNKITTDYTEQDGHTLKE